jgi:putative membrane protein
MNFILRVIGIFVAVAVAVWLVPGIEVGGTVSTWASVLIIALIIALLNMTIKPILQVIGLPITFITLGIFYLVINTALLYLASWLAGSLFGIDFIIASFGSGFVASIVISIVSSILNGVLGTKSV